MAINISNLGDRLNKRINSRLRGINNDVVNEWKLEASEYLMDEVVRVIKSGQSPVKGGGGQTGGNSRFKDYSKSYKDQIQGKISFRTYNGVVVPIKPQLWADRWKFKFKKIRPVNLTLTGKMLNSIDRKMLKNGFKIFFTDDKVQYHNLLGAGRSRVIRRMLPIKNQEFTYSITRRMIDILDTLIKKEIRK